MADRVANLADAAGDSLGLILDTEALPRRVRPKRPADSE
jgi:hypothetical protein